MINNEILMKLEMQVRELENKLEFMKKQVEGMCYFCVHHINEKDPHCENCYENFQPWEFNERVFDDIPSFATVNNEVQE